MLEKLEPAHDATGISHQGFEQGELLRGELDLGLAPICHAPRRVETQRSDRELGGPLRRASAYQRAQPGKKLGVGEGFGQVVVRSRVESFDPVANGIACCEHQDGRPHAGLPKRPADLEAVEPGQHDVEDDRVVLSRLPSGERVWSLVHHVDGHPFALEAALEERRELPLVLCDQDSHRSGQGPGPV